MKIYDIKFKNHPILGDLALDFTSPDGEPIDTVIIAGENGTGKSTIINAIYDLISGKKMTDVVITVEMDGEKHTLTYYGNTERENVVWVADETNWKAVVGSDQYRQKYKMSAIFSDVDINFHSQDISSVTSMSLDANSESRKSNTDLPKQVKQLLVDIQASDDAAISKACRENPEVYVKDLPVNERMPRFTRAFSYMFENMQYDSVDNVSGKKSVRFRKNDQLISIDDLSSGEKQIVYRGCFLLKDSEALNGAIVLLDEPEISLHPIWQKKILDYYKNIFTDDNGVQTSQIFVVTHSPFIIHNENRKNDKVIVLSRNNKTNLVEVQDKPEYYICESTAAVQDAFYIKDFSAEQPCVFVEGITDEKYFEKAVEVFELDVPFKFKWVGYTGDNGKPVQTGSSGIDMAYNFLVARNLAVRNICLKDCDTKCQTETKNNVTLMSVKTYENCNFKKGLENALVVDDIDLTQFYSQKTKKGDYGEESTISSFEKMKFCEYICKMKDINKIKAVLANLKDVILELIEIYEKK